MESGLTRCRVEYLETIADLNDVLSRPSVSFYDVLMNEEITDRNEVLGRIHDPDLPVQRVVAISNDRITVLFDLQDVVRWIATVPPGSSDDLRTYRTAVTCLFDEEVMDQVMDHARQVGLDVPERTPNRDEFLYAQSDPFIDYYTDWVESIPDPTIKRGIETIFYGVESDGTLAFDHHTSKQILQDLPRKMVPTVFEAFVAVGLPSWVKKQVPLTPGQANALSVDLIEKRIVANSTQGAGDYAYPQVYLQELLEIHQMAFGIADIESLVKEAEENGRDDIVRLLNSKLGEIRKRVSSPWNSKESELCKAYLYANDAGGMVEELLQRGTVGADSVRAIGDPSVLRYLWMLSIATGRYEASYDILDSYVNEGNWTYVLDNVLGSLGSSYRLGTSLRRDESDGPEGRRTALVAWTYRLRYLVATKGQKQWVQDLLCRTVLSLLSYEGFEMIMEIATTFRQDRLDDSASALADLLVSQGYLRNLVALETVLAAFPSLFGHLFERVAGDFASASVLLTTMSKLDLYGTVATVAENTYRDKDKLLLAVLEDAVGRNEGPVSAEEYSEDHRRAFSALLHEAPSYVARLYLSYLLRAGDDVMAFRDIVRDLYDQDPKNKIVLQQLYPNLFSDSDGSDPELTSPEDSGSQDLEPEYSSDAGEQSSAYTTDAEDVVPAAEELWSD